MSGIGRSVLGPCYWSLEERYSLNLRKLCQYCSYPPISSGNGAVWFFKGQYCFLLTIFLFNDTDWTSSPVGITFSSFPQSSCITKQTEISRQVSISSYSPLVQRQRSKLQVKSIFFERKSRVTMQIARKFVSVADWNFRSGQFSFSIQSSCAMTQIETLGQVNISSFSKGSVV